MFETDFHKCACVGDRITCQIGDLIATATLHYDEDITPPDDRDTGFWPSRSPDDPGYIGDVSDDEYDAQLKEMTTVMELWKQDGWWYVGVVVNVEAKGVRLTRNYQHALWGIECNYPGGDNGYLRATANELLDEALDAARKKLTELKEIETA